MMACGDGWGSGAVLGARMDMVPETALAVLAAPLILPGARAAPDALIPNRKFR